MKKDCKNCIHDEICPVWDDYNDEPCKDGYRGFCNNYDKFKDKSRYIEIPCEVGDKVYCDGKYFADHCAGKVMEFVICDVKTDAYTYHCGEPNICFRFSDFGENVFLTKEEAEAKLKELNNNE